MPTPRPFFIYMRERFHPEVQLALTTVWFTALVTGLCALSSSRPRLTVADFLCLLTLCGLNLLFRCVDEIKDLDYDRRYKPGRPLVTGAVSVGNMGDYIIVTAILLLVANLWLGLTAVAIVAAVITYSLGLLALERLSPAFSEAMLLNLGVSIQLMSGAALYVVSIYEQAHAGAPRLATLSLIAAFMFGYLQWEIARKIDLRGRAAPGEKLYSDVLGVSGAVALAAGLQGAAAGLLLWLWRPWEGQGVAAMLGWTPVLAVVAFCWRARPQRLGLGPGPGLAYLILLFGTIAVGAARAW